MSGIKPERIATYDVAKAIVMLLVVGGHIQGNGIVANANSWCDPYFSNLTVGMDMPLFFMISGYFSASLLNNRSWGRIIARTFGFVWPVLAFGVVFGAIIWTTGTKPIWKVLLYPISRVAFADWFLLTIAIVYISCAIMIRICKSNWQRFVLFVAYFVGLFFAPRGIPFHWTSNVMHMFPYFVFGLFFLRSWKLHKKIWIAVPAGLLFLGVVIFEGDANANGMSFYTVTTDWRVTLSSVHLILCFFARTLVGICGSVFLLWFVDELCRHLTIMRRIAVFGTTTLGVYVMHQWPLVQVKEFGLMTTPLSGYWKWPLAIMIFMGCHYLTKLLRHSQRLNHIFFGNESLLAERIDCHIRNTDVSNK